MKQYKWPVWARNLPPYDPTATKGTYNIPNVGAVQLKDLNGVTMRDLYAFASGSRHQFADFPGDTQRVRTLRENYTWTMWLPISDYDDPIKSYAEILL